MELQKSLQLNIAVAKQGLLFGRNNSPVYDAVISQFRDCIKQKVDKLTGYLVKNNAFLYEQIMEKWTDLSPQVDLHPLFFYPETLYHLYVDHDPEETGKYLHQALDAERAKRDNLFDTGLYDYLWTTNGDFFLQCNKESGTFDAFESFRINDVLPLDFFSPYCIKATAEELHEQPGSIVDEYDYSGAYAVYERIYDCLDQINKRGDATDINDLIYKFTSVIVLKRQNYGLPNRHFFSSSDAYCIGRTVLGNAELVNREMLIDSIVHEATHAFLYMLDEKFPWQPSLEESGRIGNTVLSPWSGNMLSIRNYLQAIFVWYALFNLWRYALDEQVYDPVFAQKRINMIRNGFQQVDIHHTGKVLNCRFNEVLIETVLDIRKYVISN